MRCPCSAADRATAQGRAAFRKAEGADSRGPGRSSYSSRSRAIGRPVLLVVLKQRTRIGIKTEDKRPFLARVSNDVSILAPFKLAAMRHDMMVHRKIGP